MASTIPSIRQRSSIGGQRKIRQVSDIPSGDALRILQDESVVSTVDFWAQMRLSGARRPYQLAFYDTDEKIRKAFEVKDMAGGFKFLVYRGTATEAMLDVTGLLIDYNLPPLSPKYRVTREANTLNYFACIVAPQNPEFLLAQKALKRIFSYFSESFAPGNLHAFKPQTIGEEGAICAKTRIVTPHERNAFEEVPIPDRVDDHGVIAQLVSSGKFVHTDDNVIEYEELVPGVQPMTVDKRLGYPHSFCIGQQVEATISFRTVKIGQANTPLIHLDRLVLLKRTGTQLLEAEVERQQSESVFSVPEAKIIRKRRLEVDDSPDERMKKACYELLLGPIDEPVQPQATDDQADNQICAEEAINGEDHADQPVDDNEFYTNDNNASYGGNQADEAFEGGEPMEEDAGDVETGEEPHGEQCGESYDTEQQNPLVHIQL